MDAKTQLRKLVLFDAKAPRYTSYPTALHFADDVGPSKFSSWISAIEPGSKVSLYIHVPFCRRLCWFCACRTQGTQSDAPVNAYLVSLKAELTLLGQKLPEGVTLSRLHWGGGTPTLLSASQMTELAAAVRAITPWDTDTEFSVEIDPNEIDTERLEALQAAGLTRASIGVQDFDPGIQKCIGRIQGYDTTRDAALALRAHGIKRIDTDILFGLPYQSKARITESVQKLLSLHPDRIALYGYAHVPWVAKRQQMIPSGALPTPEERLELFQTAQRLFLWDGYKTVGIDHFARAEDSLSTAQEAGTLRRSFQGYTDDTAEVLIGVGASSISRFPQGYAQNAPATGAHTAAIRAGSFSTTRGHVFTGEDRMRAQIIEALLCDFRVDTAAICDQFKVPRATVHAILSRAQDRFAGLLTLNASGLFIPKEARPLTRMIAQSVDMYEMRTEGHSSAI